VRLLIESEDTMTTMQEITLDLEPITFGLTDRSIEAIKECQTIARSVSLAILDWKGAMKAFRSARPKDRDQAILKRQHAASQAMALSDALASAIRTAEDVLIQDSHAIFGDHRSKGFGAGCQITMSLRGGWVGHGGLAQAIVNAGANLSHADGVIWSALGRGIWDRSRSLYPEDLTPPKPMGYSYLVALASLIGFSQALCVAPMACGKHTEIPKIFGSSKRYSKWKPLAIMRRDASR